MNKTRLKEIYQEIYEEQMAEGGIDNSHGLKYDDIYGQIKSIVTALEDGETGAGYPGLEALYKKADKLEDAIFKAKSKINKLEG